MQENQFFVDSDKLSEKALEKKHRLETDPSVRTNHMEYMEGMEQISSDIMEKVLGQMDQDYMEGVLRIKKIGERDYDVVLMTGAAYRVLHATVSPEGVAYRYLFKEADTPLVRGRITQFLNLLLAEEGQFKSRRFKGENVIVTYQGREAKEQFFYRKGAFYPYAAKSVVALNTGDLAYEEYAPLDAEGTEEVPHVVVYKDGNVTLDMTLISLR